MTQQRRSGRKKVKQEECRQQRRRSMLSLMAVGSIGCAQGMTINHHSSTTHPISPTPTGPSTGKGSNNDALNLVNTAMRLREGKRRHNKPDGINNNNVVSRRVNDALILRPLCYLPPIIDDDDASLIAALFDDDINSNPEGSDDDKYDSDDSTIRGYSNYDDGEEDDDYFCGEDEYYTRHEEGGAARLPRFNDYDTNAAAEFRLRQNAIQNRRNRMNHQHLKQSKVQQPLIKLGVKESLGTKHERLVKQKKKVPVTVEKKENVEEESGHLTTDEENSLGYAVRLGTELNAISEQFESKHGRSPSKKEWIEECRASDKINSSIRTTKDLRRAVNAHRVAKNVLVTSNMGLVHAEVRLMMAATHGYKNSADSGSGGIGARWDGVSYDELVQEGSMGLIRAAELYDPSRGTKFSTYATHWVKGILRNSGHLGETIKLPAREKNKWNRIQKAAMLGKSDISTGSGTTTAVEIAARCGMNESEMERVASRMSRARNVLSLDRAITAGSSSAPASSTSSFEKSTTMLGDVLSGDSNGANPHGTGDDSSFEGRFSISTDLTSTLSRNLNEREEQLVRLRYGLDIDVDCVRKQGDGKVVLNVKDGRSLTECAAIMGLGRSRAQQLAAGSLKKLREADEAECLREYLLSS